MFRNKRKVTPKSKHWCLTINNYTKKDSPFKTDTDVLEHFAYLILGKEVGDDGTPHLQGYCVYKNRVHLTKVKKDWPRAHLEIKKGTPQEASDYCKKADDYTEWGTLPLTAALATKLRWDTAYKNARKGDFDKIPTNMLIPYYHSFKRIFQDNPLKYATLSKADNHWIVAPTGYGKSTYAREKWPKYYDKSPNKWWIGYKKEPTILCDDFGPKQFQHLDWLMKRWADVFSFPMEDKGGGRVIRPLRIIVTSQYTISECFEDYMCAQAISNRFCVTELKHWQVREEEEITKSDLSDSNGSTPAHP